MKKPKINKEKCEGCGFCVDYCDSGKLKINSEGKAKVVKSEPCGGCEICASLCPTNALEFKEIKKDC